VFLENPKLTRCQKRQKPSKHPFGIFGTPSVSVLWKICALPRECGDECPGAVPVLVCHDEVVVKCDAKQATDAKAWLKKAMIEGMEAVLNGTDEVDVSVEVEARIARSWGEGG
jgi:hypothetical protein